MKVFLGQNVSFITLRIPKNLQSELDFVEVGTLSFNFDCDSTNVPLHLTEYFDISAKNQEKL